MVLFPNAKINLGLFVTEKRLDGYHNIQSILYPVPVFDALELIPAKDQVFRFSASGILVPGNDDSNLCVKAWEMLSADFNLPPVHIHLHKQIPLGAGLGGGSADAAFMIKLINHEFQLGLADEGMEDYAAKLGMDCPFFIKNKPAFAQQRGDKLLVVDLDLSGKFLVLVKPDCHISTKDAYTGIEVSQPAHSLTESIKLPVPEWKELLINDFEKVVFPKFPEIAKIKQMLYNYGAIFASMSGSGSAVFGIFDTEVELQSFFPTQFYWGGGLR